MICLCPLTYDITHNELRQRKLRTGYRRDFINIFSTIFQIILYVLEIDTFMVCYICISQYNILHSILIFDDVILQGEIPSVMFCGARRVMTETSNEEVVKLVLYLFMYPFQ